MTQQHLHEKTLLKLKKILDNLEIRFWLKGSVLLYAIRNKRYIPSNDIDIGILAVDFTPLICKETMKNNFSICKIIKWKRTEKIKSKKLIGKVRRIIIKKSGVPKISIGVGYYYPPDDIYISLNLKRPLEQRTITPAKFYKDYFIKFLGKQFRIPNPPEELLQRHYGIPGIPETWKIPMKKGWQKYYKPISLKKYIKWFNNHPEKEWIK